MQRELTMERLDQMRGATVYDEAGEKIGRVEEIFADVDTEQPEWIGIGTGFLGTKRVLVPLQGATMDDDGFRVAYGKDLIKDSPDIDGDEISQDTERELAAHYGVGYSERRSDTGLPEGRAETREPQADGTSMTRSEEELSVGKREVETGRARLRKWVETENKQVDLELKHETAHVTREAIDQPVGDRELGEDEIEVTLHAEEAVVSKQTVAKERIGLETETESETETVQGEIRKERVEIEGDVREERR